MSDIAEGDCEWPESHPPHLWGDLLVLGDASVKMTVWACSGEAKDVD